MEVFFMKHNYELRSEANRMPITFKTLEECSAMVQYLSFKNVDVIFTDLTDKNDICEFDFDLYKKHLHDFTNKLNHQRYIDSLILIKNCANHESINYSDLLMPIIKENDKLVEQYKNGNDKALNALVGKVMKIDKSYSAVVIKEELIKLMAE
jgi:hypothetical protein